MFKTELSATSVESAQGNEAGGREMMGRVL